MKLIRNYFADNGRIPGEVACRDALKAMEGQILDRAVLTGTYTLNPKLAP